MKKQILALLIFCGFLNVAIAQTQEIEKILLEIPEIIFQEIEPAEGFESSYELRVKQPLDHSNNSKGYFYQRVFLSHKGFNQPSVMVTEGYGATQNRISELTQLINANQIQVEHRYFGVSLPDSLNYAYLNLEQATADLHHIKQIFGKIYKEKWISTGISKGGATTIIYRYFYPNDVDVSVPYVAPINRSLEEERIYKFLDTVGSNECRSKIENFQKRILQNREKILPLVKFYSLGASAKYTYLTLNEAFEYAVMEYPFSFWQWGHQCEDIPGQTATIEELTTYLISVSEITFFSDQSIEFYAPHYYQSTTEMGYYGYETSGFKDLILELSTDSNPQATFIPFETNQEFDGTLLNNLNNWLETDANKIIYIYGGNDTWSASAVLPNKNVDSAWFMMKGKHHGNARIRNMTPSEKERFIATMEKWLSIKIENNNK